MRLWPKRNAAAVTAATPPTNQGTTGPIGASGTINLHGYLQAHEYNPDLRGHKGLLVYDRMRRSDPSVREAMFHIKAPILNAEWTIEDASDDPLDVEVAEFVRRAYFEWLEQPWQTHLSQALTFLDFGVYVGETDWQVVDAALDVEGPNGDKVTLPTRQFVTWRRIAQRLPATIWKWNQSRGVLESITQQAFTDEGYQEVEIPADDLMVLVHEQEGDDFNGQSLLRAAYKPWVMKETVEKVAAIAVERHGVGIPIAYMPANQDTNTQLLGRLESILQNLRAGEYTYIVAPFPKQQSVQGGASQGGLIEILTPSGGIPDFTGLLEYFRGEIKGGLLSRFSELGHGSMGARSTGDTQSEVWRDALHGVARHVSDVHQKLIRRLVDKNYVAERYPRLCVGDIESKNLDEFSSAVSKLTASGALLADRSLRDFVRRTIDAPEEDEDAEEQTQDAKPHDPDVPAPPDPLEPTPPLPPDGR